MAGTSFNSKAWEKSLKKMKGRVRNPENLLRSAFAVMGFRDVLQHFDEERGPSGAWAPLTRRQGKILQDTGNLRQNFNVSNVEKMNRTGIIFFNPTPYASTHNDGDPDRNIPKREFMYITRKAEKRMADFFASQLRKI